MSTATKAPGTLVLKPGPGPLRTEHQRLLRTALKRGANTPEEAVQQSRDTAYHPGILQHGIASWRERALHEHHSAAVFSRLLPQLMAAEASLDYKTVILRASMDELRHASLCAGIVEYLGGDPTMDTDLYTAPLPEHENVSRKEAALRNMLFASCMSETVSVSLLSEERDLCTDPVVNAVLTQLSADEILHAKLGWAYLTETLPQLGEDGAQRLSAYLPTAFGYLEAKMLSAMPIGHPIPKALEPQAHALGLMSGQDGREIFYATVEAVIIPRLESFGMKAADGWRTRIQSV